jgi:hypothetical protein
MTTTSGPGEGAAAGSMTAIGDSAMGLQRQGWSGACAG